MSEKNSRLKIIHIVSGDVWAGAEVQVYQLCCALKSSIGVDVRVITFNRGKLEKKLTQNLIPVHVIDETELSAVSMTKALTRVLKQEQPGIIHTHGQKENILGSLAGAIARVPKSVRTVHGNSEIRYSLKSPHKPVLSLIDFLIGRYFQDATVAVSEQLRAKQSDLFPKKVHKINNFIDIDRLRQDFGRQRKTGFEAPLHIGLVGRLVPVKRADLFIDSLRILDERYRLNFRASIIGDGPLMAELKSQVNRLGLNHLVNFLGFVDPVYEDVASLDVLILPSDHEGLPMVIIEAQALEVLVVAHAVGGIPDALAHGDAGCLVTDHSPAGYARAIADLATSPAADQIRRSALAHAEAEFGWKMNSKQYLELYESLSN